MNDYIKSWEIDRPEEVKRLCDSGVVPMAKDMEDEKDDVDMPFLMGQVAGVIQKIQPAKEIVEEMVQECVDMLQQQQSFLGSGRTSRL